MDEIKSSAGGPTTSMENSIPSQVQNAPESQNLQANPAASQPTDFYAQQPQHVAQHDDQSTQQQSAKTSDNNNNVAINTTNPAIAEDSDLIEKEWVEKAKGIVEKTRREPFTQSQELNRLKTEYLQKRYGKNVGMGGQ